MIQIKNAAQIAAINLKKSYSVNEKVAVKVTTSGNSSGTKLKLSITDNTGRLLCKQEGNSLVWDTRNALVNRHEVRAELYRNNQLIEVKKEAFFLPEVLI